MHASLLRGFTGVNGQVHSLCHRGDRRDLLHAMMLRLVWMVRGLGRAGVHGLGRTVVHIVATGVRLLLLLWRRHRLCRALHLLRLCGIHARHMTSRHCTIHVSGHVLRWRDVLHLMQRLLLHVLRRLLRLHMRLRLLWRVLHVLLGRL